MFDKFGEFDSWDEINRTAAGLKTEGDLDSIVELAKENGIDVEDAQDYIAGDIQELCTSLTAAFGKLQLEDDDLRSQDIMNDWFKYIMTLVAGDEKMAVAVRRKGKSLKGCIGALLKWSFEHQQDVDKDIIKAAGVSASRITLGIPGMAMAHKIIKEYYLGGAK